MRQQAAHLLLLLSFLPFGSSWSVHGQSGTGMPAEPSAFEFPPLESYVWNLQREFHTAMRRSSPVALPASPGFAGQLLRQAKYNQAISEIQAIIERQPELIGPTFRQFNDSAGTGYRGDNPSEYFEKVRGLVDSARRRLTGLSREPAADAARWLAIVESSLPGATTAQRLSSLKRIVDEYPGTDAALQAEIDCLLAAEYRMPERFAALDRFVSAHPGTAAAARALHQKAFDLSVNHVVPNTDPTDRFLQVLEISKELESGRYPACEWTRTATSPVIDFFAYQPKYETGNIERLLEAYRNFVKTHLTLESPDTLSSGVGYVISSKMGELYQLKGEGPAAVERMLLELEKDSGEPDSLRYFRAMWYMGQGRIRQPGPEASAFFDKAVNTLAGIRATGKELYRRKALATLACTFFFLRDYRNAGPRFKEYVDSYPKSDYAWVAALRAGQCGEKLENWSAAFDAYARVPRSFAPEPLALVFGETYSARASEAVGQFDRAAAAYRRALGAWRNDFRRESLSLLFYQFGTERDYQRVEDETQVTRVGLLERVDQLKKSKAAPGGTLLEGGRWLIGRRRWQEAADVLEQLVKRYPRSPNVTEAFYLMHLASLEDALELADGENPRHDEPAAIEAAEKLTAAQPYDLAVGAAKVTRACLLLKQRRTGDAERLMLEALQEWQRWQGRSPAEDHMTGLEKDVAEIRRIVFRPMGAAFFGQLRWNGLSWPAELPRFVVVSPEVSVKFSNGLLDRVVLYQTFPQLNNVLFVNAEQRGLFARILTRLGGTGKRVPTSVMGVPNQPIGVAVDLMSFLNKFFPVRPGHWGGWELETYPQVSRITFTNDERTRALASVVIGYAGADVLLQKDAEGHWVVKELLNHWVT